MVDAERKKSPGGTRKRPSEATGARVLMEVEKRNSIYHIYDPQLDITVRNKDLSTGYAELNEHRAEVLQKLEEAGVPVPDVRTASSGVSELPRSRSQRLTVALVAGVVVVVLVYTLAVAPLLRGIETAYSGLERLKEMARPDVAPRLASKSVSAFADALENMTPARREEVRKNLRRIARELRPFMVEIAPAVEPLTGTRLEKTGEGSGEDRPGAQ